MMWTFNDFVGASYFVGVQCASHDGSISPRPFGFVASSEISCYRTPCETMGLR